MSIVAKRLDGQRRHLVRKSNTMWPRPHCIRRVPASHERGTAAPIFGPCLLWPRSPISAAAELFTVMLLMGIQGCQTVSPSIDRSKILMYSRIFPSPFLSSLPLPIASLSSPPSTSTSTSLSEVGPLIADWESGEGISSPADSGGARPPNAFWCIVGIN